MYPRQKTVRIAVAVATLLTPVVASPAFGAASERPLTADCKVVADTVDPQVTSLKLTPSVSVQNHAATVQVTADAVDTEASPNETAVPGSGVKKLTVQIEGPSYAIEDGTLKLSSGTATDGVWKGSIKIQQNEDVGTWYVDDVSATDADGNVAYYSGFGSGGYVSPNDPRLQSGWDTTVKVQGTPRKQVKDTVKSLAVNATHVDTRQHTAHLVVTARLNGPVYGPRTVAVAFGHKDLSFGSWLVHRSGDRYEAKLTVPTWLGTATFTSSVFAYYFWDDYDGRTVKGGPALRLKVQSRVDKTAPRIASLRLSPTSVNTTKSSQSVTLSAKIADSQSGVESGNYNTYFSLEGPGTTGALFNVHRRNGSWVGTTSIPRCVGDGTWKLSGYVTDHDGNSREYSEKALAAAHLSTTLKVTSKSPGDTTPPAVTSNSFDGPNTPGTIDLSFTEPVLNVTAADLSIYQGVGTDSADYGSPLSITDITCYDAKKNVVDCGGSSGNVTSALLNVSGMQSGHRYLIYANQKSVVPQLTDRAGNPMDDSEIIALRE